MTVAGAVDAGSRRDRSQPALRLPGGSTPEPPDSRGLTRLADLVEEVAAWEDSRNKKHVKADWHFTTENARIKLKHLYPLL